MFLSNNNKGTVFKSGTNDQLYYIDYNVHLLPSSVGEFKDLNLAVDLIRQLVNFGITKMVLTTFVSEIVFNPKESILRSFKDLSQELVNQKVNVELLLAGQYQIDKNFIFILKRGDILPLGKNYVLLDLPLEAEPPLIENIIFELEVNGYKPILVHPERYEYYHELTLKRYRKLRSLGCLLQCSILSFAGFYGDKAKKFGQKLAKEKLVDFFGSNVQSEEQVKYLLHFLKFHGQQFRFPLKNVEIFG